MLFVHMVAALVSGSKPYIQRSCPNSKLLNNPEKPVQIIFAGKAHPADGPAHEIINISMTLQSRKDSTVKLF